MEVTLIIIILAICAGLIKGFTGFGLSIILISVLLNMGILPTKLLPILVPLFIVLDLILFFENMKFIKIDFKENFTLHSTTLMTLFIGLLIGTHLLTIGNSKYLQLIFAIIILISLFFLIGKVELHQMRIPNERLNGIFGFITGILTGLFTMNAVPPSIYMIYHQYPKEKYMGSLVTFLIISDILLISVYLFKNLFTLEGLLISIKLFFMVLFGFAIGIILRKKVSSKYFKSIVIFILAINSLKIIFDFFFN